MSDWSRRSDAKADPFRWQRIGELFDRALAVASTERLELIRASGEAAEIQEEVLKLLGAHETSEGFLAWLTGLKRKVGIPENLTQASVSRDKLDVLVGIATDDACHPNNPRPCGREDFVRIFTRAFG